MKKNVLLYFRVLLLLVGFACGIGCATLSQDEVIENTSFNPTRIVETGLNGSAIGLGIISGMCFLGAAITFLRKD